MRDYLYSLATNKTKGFIAGIIKVFLLAFSIIYGLVVRVLFFFSQFYPYRLHCKVISVGNITLGGTGKTSLVEAIARYLKEQGHKVVILTRGYKRKISDCTCLSAGRELAISDYENMGDEPYMLKMNLKDIPVIVDADRIRAGNRAIRDYAADTVIFDDGFQQWRMKKDLEIITIDATNPFGNLHMLPRGILREPLSSLKRADVFVLTKINLNLDTAGIKYMLNKLNPSGIIIESIHKPVGFYNIENPKELFDIGALKGKTVTLFSGIGDPCSFENLLACLDINIGLSFKFADHHNYSRQDLDRIFKTSRERNIDTIITTEKDAARLGSLRLTTYDLRLLVLRIELEIKDEQRFYNRLLKLYSL